MNTPLRNKFELQIRSLTGFDFQDFVIEVYLHLYGEQGFTVLRKTKDKGCDGLINEEKRVIACFGQKNNNQKAFEKKADDDYLDFTSNWQKQYPNWMFIINQDVTPAQETKIKSLNSDAPLIGVKQILHIIDEKLKKSQRRKVAEYLRIDKEEMASDYIGEILSDLLAEFDSDENIAGYNPKSITEITEKIGLNYTADEIEEAVTEYGNFLEGGTFTEVHSLLHSYEDDEIAKIKGRILYDYSNSGSGSFKERLRIITEKYLAKYSSEEDDDYLFYIRGVLVYLFEQCLIGKKTGGEL